jgi:4-diphosphocytidyl-2-C-methyl-D-erythritol kinase
MKRDSTRPRRVTAYGSAKINIGLRVGPLRGDGYHEVCGLVHTVSLVDRLQVAVGGDEPVTLHIPGHPDLESQDNLIVAAARELAERCDPVNVTIDVEKVIPVAAGLGGGSADAAAALAALNVVWRAGLSAAKLLELGGRIGSDVPAILAGGLVHISGRGERTRAVGSATEGAFVLGISDARISASDAYMRFDELEPVRTEAVHHNDLEDAAVAIIPELRARIGAMRDAGAAPVFVSGSGPTVVGVASDDANAEAIAARATEAFDRTEIVHPSPWGVRVTMGSPDARLD